MPFSRRILHHGSQPSGAPLLLDDRAVQNCWFELHRQGGCGAGELKIQDEFRLRHDIKPGDWISFEGAPGQRWYLGRVAEIRSASPAGMRLRLEGMSVQLNEVFPGGFGLQADGVPPHRYGATDLFLNDPDHAQETADYAQTVDQVVQLLLSQYVVTATAIQYVSALIEPPQHPAEVTSLKFRGEETVRTVIKDLAMRAQSASWGVDAAGQFFFLRPRDTLLTTLREGRDLTALAETRDREYLYNRLLLTGDYVYDRREESNAIARRTFRWRGNFMQSQSRQQFGERRLKLWIPWIRTQADAHAFAREFFRTYAQPTARYLVETVPQTTLLIPWAGRIALEDQQGNHLATTRIETVRIQFDHRPRYRMELGPEDPRTLWPEPPQDERWESPEIIQAIGGSISHLDTFRNSDQPPQSTLPPASTLSSLFTSDESSDLSSELSSDWSSDWSSHWTATSGITNSVGSSFSDLDTTTTVESTGSSNTSGSESLTSLVVSSSGSSSEGTSASNSGDQSSNSEQDSSQASSQDSLTSSDSSSSQHASSSHDSDSQAASSSESESNSDSGSTTASESVATDNSSQNPSDSGSLSSAGTMDTDPTGPTSTGPTSTGLTSTGLTSFNLSTVPGSDSWNWSISTEPVSSDWSSTEWSLTFFDA